MSLTDSYVKVRLALDARKRDPLAHWRYVCPNAKRAAEALQTVDEIYVRASNAGGKTELGGGITLRCLQGLPLNGVVLPKWKGPVAGVVLVRDYKQQKLSVQQTVLRLLGDWPHKAKWQGDDVLSSLRIAPAGRDVPEEQWSSLTFMSQENRRSGLGARADVVWADEPPDQEIWREFRKSAHAGRKNVRIITATPIKRREWTWLKDEYGDPPRGSVTVHKNRAEVRWSLFDNQFLTQDHIQKLLDEYAHDPLYGKDGGARVYGDYLDTTSTCPFDVETLLAMLEECHDPQVKAWKISRELRDENASTDTVQVQVWQEPVPGRHYWIVIDPSSGVDDSKHDPCGLHVLEVGSGDLVARYSGRLAPYSLGVLAAGLARQYNSAQVEPEINDGWGAGVVQGVRDSGYGNLSHEKREVRPGVFSSEVGFRTNHQSRSAMIAAVQAWIEAWRSGIRYGHCPSREVIECLLDCGLDEAGKVAAAPGLHDEDLILRGQGLRRCATLTGRTVRAPLSPPLTPDQSLILAIQGKERNGHQTQLPVRAGRRPPRV